MWTAQAIFVCALDLLGRSERNFPPTQLVETAPAGVSRQAAAYVSRGEPPRIVLITSTLAFLAARRVRSQCGDLDATREIAGVLVHEEWHLRHGPDEEWAYDAQLTTLLFLGAHQDGPLYHKVFKAKQAVLAATRRTSPTTIVAAAATSGRTDGGSSIGAQPGRGR